LVKMSKRHISLIQVAPASEEEEDRSP